MSGFISSQAAMLQTRQRMKERDVILLGVDLTDAREEIFVRMVCDGLAIGVAFVKAGFPVSANNKGQFDAARKLFNLPRIQNRAAAILEARRTQGVVTLPEVTDMLQRVFAEALHGDQLNAAHNAAFSLARLYGHVTDRAIVETLRKPSRDPDAPAERSLTNWIDALPVRALEGPGPAEGLGEAPAETASASPRAAIEQGSSPRAAIEEQQGSSPGATYQRVLASPQGSEGSGPKPLISQGFSSPEGSGLGPRQSGNGAPVGPVTKIPPTGTGSAILSLGGGNRKRASKRPKVPVLSGAAKRKKRRMKELFG